MTGSALLERPQRLPATVGTAWRRPDELVPGDVVVIEDRQPSSEGFVHVVAEARADADGWVRVFYDVWRDGERFRSVAYPHDDYRWDRLYSMRPTPLVGHRWPGCDCSLCLERALDVPMVEVVA